MEKDPVRRVNAVRANPTIVLVSLVAFDRTDVPEKHNLFGEQE
jgi:hypothetical protein